MKNDIVLEVKNLNKQFGSFTAVDNLSLSIKEGEVLGLLGPNGAGKTTTIQMLLGVMESTSGTIEYFGREFPKYRQETLGKINFSSTYISMPWEFTLEEILLLYARLYEVPDKKRRIDKLLKEFEIYDMRKKQFKMLSAGEKTRLFLAKAFLNYPKLILLDEPTASLDPDIAVKIREFLKRERSEYNVSMLFTSHNMSEVEEMCDRVIIMKSGKIVDEDTPENLAKKIKGAHVELLIIKDHAKAIEFLSKNKYSYEIDNKTIRVAIDEEKISGFLHSIFVEKIKCDEINISRPTLEDYFLEVVNSVKEEEK